MRIHCRLPEVVLLCLVVTLVAAAAGCGSAPAPATTEIPQPVHSRTPSTATATSEDDADAGQPFGVDLFGTLAGAMAPMPVYGFAKLPAGADIVLEWWPVLSLDGPDDYGGPGIPNPLVSRADGEDPGVQLVLRYGDGWLVVLENFRGDLGETEGVEVGTVEGHPAALYEVNGGKLVQWSDGGAWYGLFGRGLAVETVTELAQEIQLIDAAERADEKNLPDASDGH